MRLAIKPRINRLIDNIFQEANATATRLAQIRHPERRHPEHENYFETNCPGSAGHDFTDPASLLRHIETVSHLVPLTGEESVVSLGSGLGMDSFVFALIFCSVTGFEVDQEVITEARRIQALFGLTNINFIKRNFLEPKVDLSPYDLVYFYKPLEYDFEKKIGELVQSAKPGAIVISRAFPHRALHRQKKFKVIYPFDWDPTCRFMASDYYTAVRLKD
ncbi:MAG: class I SAM-dependent methyltransferase [Candidatus Margulisbacteria bacterium]|nr:class I SAM-dependent methyltransferase [Candidatus Margulisiibacteriota bacterium]